LTQKSIFWTTGATGDGAAAYTQTELFSFFGRTLLGNPAAQGVMSNYGNGLAFLSGTTSPVQIGTGAAIVNGTPYLNDSAVNLTITTPTTGTTGYAIILRADYTAQTVRLIAKGNTDGNSAIPTMTQTGSIWEIPIHTFTIATSGTMSNITDKRKYLTPGLVSYFNYTTGQYNDSIIYNNGNVGLGASATSTVNFNKAYPVGVTPMVLMSVFGSSTYNDKDVFITSITNTGFVVNNTAPVLLQINFIAMGLQ
jgi:hypothetical protein